MTLTFFLLGSASFFAIVSEKGFMAWKDSLSSDFQNNDDDDNVGWCK